MIDFIQWIGAVGGVGAVFAVLMFYVYRQTNRQMRDDRIYMNEQSRSDRKFAEDRLTKLIEDYNDICSAHQEALVKHTQIQAELYTWLRAKNGNPR